MPCFQMLAQITHYRRVSSSDAVSGSGATGTARSVRHVQGQRQLSVSALRIHRRLLRSDAIPAARLASDAGQEWDRVPAEAVPLARDERASRVHRTL